MRLIGNYVSPYVRRVAITLNLLEVPFEQEEVFVFKTPEKVRPHNPLTRIPALVLDDGETLIESGAILDAIDQLVGPEKALTPPSGAPRRRVQKVTAIAVGCMEKAQWAFYEMNMRPEDKIHPPWRERNEGQVLAGLEDLEQRAAAAGDWLAGTPGMSQADVSAAVAFSFVQRMRPGLIAEGQFPALAAFTARCEALPAFQAAPIPA